jgi:hypothetical protein
LPALLVAAELPLLGVLIGVLGSSDELFWLGFVPVTELRGVAP